MRKQPKARFVPSDFMVPDEAAALCAMVDVFAERMKEKLLKKMDEGQTNWWDDANWSIEEIKDGIKAHIDKGDPLDVANLTAFWWNLQPTIEQQGKEGR